MSDDHIRISDAELQLLQLLWEESPLGAAEIERVAEVSGVRGTHLRT